MKQEYEYDYNKMVDFCSTDTPREVCRGINMSKIINVGLVD